MNVEPVRLDQAKEESMPEAISYTEELQTMLDRTIARGNPNAQDIKSLCSVIFRMNERIKALEEQIVLDEKK